MFETTITLTKALLVGLAIIVLLSLAGNIVFKSNSPVHQSLQVKQVSAKSFKQEVEESEIPVIVDFYATWCGPCKMLAPNLEEIASEYAGKVKIVKVDVDQNRELSTRFSVRRMPTIITFKNGKKQEVMLGYKSIEELKAICEKLLK